MSIVEGKVNLFVFYKFNPNASKNTWLYKRFPKGWDWIGGGGIPLESGFEREEQFNGSKEGQKNMKEYLKKFFDKLKKDGIITKFKIHNSFLRK